MEIHLTTMECHLPYHGITQCYLPPDTSEHSLYPSQTGWYSIYQPFKGGGLSKPRPRVQRATGPQLLRDSQRPAKPEPTT